MKVLYFAWLRNRVGLAEEQVTPPAVITTVSQLIDWLKARSPGHAHAFANPMLVRAAVNQTYAGPDHPLAPDDEVAFFPPVTGGSGNRPDGEKPLGSRAQRWETDAGHARSSRSVFLSACSIGILS